MAELPIQQAFLIGVVSPLSAEKFIIRRQKQNKKTY